MGLIYQDEFIIAWNKPAGQFVHPIPGDNASKECLLFEVRDFISQLVYPINRLDRPVSGIVLFAKTPEVVTEFQNIWHAENTQKKYLCLHRGKLESAGKFDSPLSKQGVFKQEAKKELKQDALTLYSPIEFFPHEFCTYNQVEIKTGRYHQIRRHFRKAIMPIIGDRKHGKGLVNKYFAQTYGLDQIFLHCHELEFIHPLLKTEILLKAQLPMSLVNVIDQLKQNADQSQRL